VDRPPNPNLAPGLSGPETDEVHANSRMEAKRPIRG
jgi:hypothetical protein